MWLTFKANVHVLSLVAKTFCLIVGLKQKIDNLYLNKKHPYNNHDSQKANPSSMNSVATRHSELQLYKSSISSESLILLPVERVFQAKTIKHASSRLCDLLWRNREQVARLIFLIIYLYTIGITLCIQQNAMPPGINGVRSWVTHFIIVKVSHSYWKGVPQLQDLNALSDFIG